MYTISKEFHFSASHILEGLPDDHPCGRLHGHNYKVTLFLASTSLDDKGFVVDYGDLATFKQYIDAKLDHRHLNDVMDCNPTAENLARKLYLFAEVFWPEQLLGVEVSETPKTTAVYTRGLRW